MEFKIAGSKLTVIIRDDAPMIHCADMPTYRRITIDLTPDQRHQLKLFATSTQSSKPIFESVSNCFLE